MKYDAKENASMQKMEAFISTLTSIIQLCKKANQVGQGSIVDPGKCDVFCVQTGDISTSIARQDVGESFELVRKQILNIKIPRRRRKIFLESIHANFSVYYPDFGDINYGRVGLDGRFNSPMSRSGSHLGSLDFENPTSRSSIRKVDRLPKETTEFLERVFLRKRVLNSKERMAVAKKCGIEPIQVRIWFTNKRMRSK